MTRLVLGHIDKVSHIVYLRKFTSIPSCLLAVASYSKHVSEDWDLILEAMVRGEDREEGLGPGQSWYREGTTCSPQSTLPFLALRLQGQTGIGMTHSELGSS